MLISCTISDAQDSVSSAKSIDGDDVSPQYVLPAFSKFKSFGAKTVKPRKSVFKNSIMMFVGAAAFFTGLMVSVPQTAQAQSRAFATTNNSVERRALSIKSGEDISNALNRVGASFSDIRIAVQALSRVIDTKDIRRDDQLTVFMRNEGSAKRLLGFNLASGADRSITVARSFDGKYTARELTTKMKKRSLRVAGVIGSKGLLQSVREQGAPDRVADAIADAFAYDVDFQREVGPGSSFEIMFDRVSDARGAVVREGEPTYAKLTTTSGRSMELYRFRAAGDSAGEWYDENGRSARKFLMRTPLNGARLTSNFGYRVHPISGYTKLHAGVDFGTPVGTPVFAAGDGIVTRVGIMGGYGKVVDVQHSSGWSTRYAHLSGFAQNIKVGDHVKQGETIALSGNTGRSTGPHLHFEIRQNGTPINPMSAQVPNDSQLNANDLRKFKTQVAQIDSIRRAAMNGVNVADNGLTVRASN